MVRAQYWSKPSTGGADSDERHDDRFCEARLRLHGMLGVGWARGAARADHRGDGEWPP